MKMKTLFAVFVTAMLFALITSCKTTPKDMLTKRWQSSDITATGITPDLKASFLANQLSIDFKDDGKYVGYTKGKEDDKGAYTLSEDGKTITMNSEKGQATAIAVKELTKEKMVGSIMGADVTFIPYNK